jgi:hypothetical protein
MMQHFRLLLKSSLLALALALASCANPYKVKELDESKLEKKGEFQGATIGLNENREVIIEQKTEADSELRKLAATAYDLEVRVTRTHEDLTRCREELADPRLGGSGKIVDIPEVDEIKPVTEVKEEFGITKDGKLSFVKQEKFLDRLQGQRKYNDTLREQLKLTEKHERTCMRELRSARVKNGLPAERYVGQGKFVNGRYVQTRRAEKNLDDAFAISSEEASKASKETSEQN